jgi:hypothetical protein
MEILMNSTEAFRLFHLALGSHVLLQQLGVRVG